MPAKLRTPRAAPLSCTRGETTAPETRFLSVLSFKNVNPTTRTIRDASLSLSLFLSICEKEEKEEEEEEEIVSYGNK